MTAPVVESSRLSANRLRTTPAIFRSWSIAISVLLIITAVFAAIAARQFAQAAGQIESNTGPVLISTQELVASVAEADAANTAVFLSDGDEDRQLRRLYLDAIIRASQRVEETAARVGDDAPSHAALQRIASQLIEYSGLVERARLGNELGAQNAEADLDAALDLVAGERGILANAQIVTDRTQESFSEVRNSGDLAFIVAVGALLLAIIALLLGQRDIRKRTKRILNLPLVVGTVAVLALGLWLILVDLGQTDDYNRASNDAYSAIRLTAELQTQTFDYKTREAQAIISNAADRLPGDERLAEINNTFNVLESNADSVREEAAITGLRVRWERYVTTSSKIENALRANGTDAARQLAITDGNRDFNGFNTTVESVLLANRDQFFDAVDSAENRLNWLQFGSIALPILAALLALAGYQSRINEYW